MELIERRFSKHVRTALQWVPYVSTEACRSASSSAVHDSMFSCKPPAIVCVCIFLWSLGFWCIVVFVGVWLAVLVTCPQGSWFLNYVRCQPTECRVVDGVRHDPNASAPHHEAANHQSVEQHTVLLRVMCQAHFIASNQHLRVYCYPKPKDIGVQKLLAILWHCVPEGVLQAEYESDDALFVVPAHSEFIAKTKIPNDETFLPRMVGIVEEWKLNVIEKTKCTPHVSDFNYFTFLLNEKGTCVSRSIHQVSSSSSSQ